ncbi:MAG: LemA family protein [Gammaproteobacteria bacterium]|nr:LemA family protein [Gammaproteobacteria bacterium]
MTGWIIIGLIVFTILMVVARYNRLVTLRNHFKNAFAQIDVQLTRRYDLIPNLVETARGYLKHERETLEAVIKARDVAAAGLKTTATDPTNRQAMQQLGMAEDALSGLLGRLFALSEAYPDLKANQNMMHFSEELASTENRVAFARQGFNDTVMVYNTARESFPDSIVANAFNFQPASLLEIEDVKKRTPPKVVFT